MGPQNSDPNNPGSNPPQADLSSVLGPPPTQSVANPTTPQADPALTPVVPTIDPNPTPMPTPPVSEPTPSMPETPLPPSLDSSPIPPTPPFPETPLPEPPSAPTLDPTSPTSAPAPSEPTIGSMPNTTTPELIDPPPDPVTNPSGSGSDLNAGFNWSNNGGLSPQAPAEPNAPMPNSLGNPLDPFAQPQNDSAPTDLSQLTGITPEPQNVYTPPMSQPETLVVSPSTPDTTVQAESTSKGIPKWAFIAGGILLIVVIGISLVFILGIGQTPKTASVPVTQQPALVTPPQPTPAQIPAAVTPVSTSSAGFGGVSGGNQPSTASSAADILKAKLQK